MSILRQSSGARRREAGCKLFANAKVLHIWGTAVNTLLQGGSDFIFSGGTASGTPIRPRRGEGAMDDILRADSGFAREALMKWCELNDVDYLFGLAKNERLVAEIAAELAAAEEESKLTEKPARRYNEFHPPAPAAFRQRPSAAGFLFRRYRTARSLP